MALGSGCSWADVMLSTDSELFVGQSDIKDYFYACGIQSELSEFFVIVDISGAELREWDHSGEWKSFYDLESVSFGFSVLPMGFSWAFYFAQQAHLDLLKNFAGSPHESLVVDGAPGPVLRDDDYCVLPYCDNLAVASTCRKTCQSILDHCIGAVRGWDSWCMRLKSPPSLPSRWVYV